MGKLRDFGRLEKKNTLPSIRCRLCEKRRRRRRESNVPRVQLEMQALPQPDIPLSRLQKKGRGGEEEENIPAALAQYFD